MAIYAGLSDLSRSFENGFRVTSVAAKSLDQEVLAASLENVGPLSAVALQVVGAIDHPDSDAHKISAEIGRDPVITAKVLSVANSAFYGGAGANSVSAAVSRLGMRTLRNLVLAAAVSDRPTDRLDRYPFAANGLWQHSLTVALLAQKNGVKLASLSDRSNDLFLCGLLHDIGKVITSQLLDIDVNSTGFDALMQETEGTGFTHIDAGLLIAKEWNLPEAVANVIAFHHDPKNAETDMELAAAIALFDVIANRRYLGLRESTEIDTLLPDHTLDILLLTESDYIDLDEAVGEQLAGINEVVKALQ